MSVRSAETTVGGLARSRASPWPWPDRARGAALRLAIAHPPLRALVTSRERRVPWLATLHALIAFPICVLAPTLSMVLGPLLLGVPHVASDVRYLVLRRGLPSWCMWTALGASVALFGLRLIETLIPSLAPFAELEMVAVAAWLVLAACAGAIASGTTRRLAIALPCASLVGLALVIDPTTARLVLVHAHNVVGLVIWAVMFRRGVRALALPLVLIAGGALFLASGATAELLLRHGWLDPLGLHVFAAADWLGCGPDFHTAVGVTCAFAFLQSVHYGVWLAYVPQDDVRAAGTLTFRMSVRSLLADFGLAGLALVAVATLAVLAGSLFDALATRALFLSLASFHGYLELAMLGYFLARGGATLRAPVSAVARSIA